MNPRFFCLYVCILLCVPAIAGAATTIIPPGGDIFLGEEGLDIRAAVPPPYNAIAFFPPGSSPMRDVPLDIRTIDTSRFTVSPGLYTDRTGTWYQWDTRRGAAGSVAFTIREPRISIRIIQERTMEDVSSGTVPRGTGLLFQIDTNTGTVSQRPGYNPAVDGILNLLITTPGGGVITAIEAKNGASVSLTGLTPSGSLPTVPSRMTGGWDTGASARGGSSLYGSGTYQVKPEFTFNRIDENLRSPERVYGISGASMTLGSDRVSITTRDDTVTRGSSFSVTISGSPGVPVYFWVDAGSKSGAGGDQPPMILFAQEGVRQDSPGGPYAIGSYQPSSQGGRTLHDLVPGQPYEGVKYYAQIVPDRYGVRTFELRTSDQTDDTRYTLRVETGPGGGSQHSDETQISVVKGRVSVVTGKDIYPIGEEVKLSGVNSESCETYLFITGPNLPSGGARLDRPREAVITGNPSSFTSASGDCETWQYTLYTGNLGLDAGTYTIYAVPSPVDRFNLGSVPYQTIPLTLRRPSVTMRQQETDVARGDSLIITGQSSGGGGSAVAIWIFGKNYFWYDEVSVERDGYFEYELAGWQTGSMVAGQYVVIVQHPMSNGEFDIWPDGARNLILGRYPYPGAPIFRVGGPGALMGSAAAQALITALDSQFIDDTYSRWDIRVTSPKISVNESSLTQVTGEPVVIEGTTNLGLGKRLLVEITDNRFAPTSKNDRTGSYGYSGTAIIVDRNGERSFVFTVPAGRLAPGEYRFIIQAVESDAMTSGLLIITEPVVAMNATTEPTMNVTLAATAPVSEPAPPVPDQAGGNASPQTPDATPAPLATTVPPSSPVQDSMIPLSQGIGIGLLIAALIVGIGYGIHRLRSSSEDGSDESGEHDEEVDTPAEGEQKEP